VTEQIKPKTPEELGEAVGKKIEELFGGMFQDEVPPSPQPPAPAATTAPEISPQPPVTQTVQPVKKAAPPVPERIEVPAEPSSPDREAPPAAVAPPPSAVPELGRAAASFQELIEQIEAIVLNLEWEMSQKSVTDLSGKLGEVEKFVPASGLLRNFLGMHQRVLARFDTPEAAPHPALLKLLTGSVAALKHLHASGGNEPLPSDLNEVLSEGYRTIMAVPASDLVAPPPAQRPAEMGPEKGLSGSINEVARRIRSLEEVSQRLSRIVGVLRQGGAMPGEEMTRRLGTLENLLATSVGQLSAAHGALAQEAASLGEGAAGTTTRDGKTGPTGVLMLIWGGAPLVVPAGAVLNAMPLTKAQAEQFKDKPAITIGNRSLPRLPLRRPQSADQKAPSLPGWFVHLAWDGKNYFLLADRSLGYRQIPASVDLESQGKVRIGSTFFSVLPLKRFR
jgi:hypothetical protein